MAAPTEDISSFKSRELQLWRCFSKTGLFTAPGARSNNYIEHMFASQEKHALEQGG